MDITLNVKVPRHPGKHIRVIVRDPKWVSDQLKLPKHQRAKGLEAAGWFQGCNGKFKVGTIALSKIDLELVSHECTHAAFFLCSEVDEERIAILTGELTKKVWGALIQEALK